MLFQGRVGWGVPKQRQCRNPTCKLGLSHTHPYPVVFPQPLDIPKFRPESFLGVVEIHCNEENKKNQTHNTLTSALLALNLFRCEEEGDRKRPFLKTPKGGRGYNERSQGSPHMRRRSVWQVAIHMYTVSFCYSMCMFVGGMNWSTVGSLHCGGFWQP